MLNSHSTSSLTLGIAAKKGQKLGDWIPSSSQFSHVYQVVEELKETFPAHLPEAVRFDGVNKQLFTLISQEKSPCFLLPAVMDYIDRVNGAKIIERYTFTSFELFLNLFSGASFEENQTIRAKIVGKKIPREKYQGIFPVGMGKVFSGPHFVTAHGSPDLDTTVASFWGWVDAFGCIVGDGLHIWNVPDGPPKGQAEIEFLFLAIFGKQIFPHLSKTRLSLSVSGLDLVSEKGMSKKTILDPVSKAIREREREALVLVDASGYYCGDWHLADAEEVSQVTLLLSNTLRSFENYLQMQLLAFFARPALHRSHVDPFLQEVLGLRLSSSLPVKDFSEKQLGDVTTFLKRVLGVKEGLESTFSLFSKAMEGLSLYAFRDFSELLESLGTSSFFDAKGHLVEDRSAIFHYLEKAMRALDLAIESLQNHVERIDIALAIKIEVFGYRPQHVSSRADIEEIRSKMGSSPYLTVTASDRMGNLFPMGIIPSNHIYRPVLGTVTLRDFCNREETKIPPYLEVISVIDHHKSHLQTSSTPVVTISDAQSSNGMLAEIAFGINDGFSTAGISQKHIEEQLAKGLKDFSHHSSKRKLQRLLQKLGNIEKQGGYFIAPEREYVEYLHFLYAILDDTDLLTKASYRDLECTAALLNRLKTLSLGEETEIVHFDDLSTDDTFIETAALRLLQNEDLYSIYSKMYRIKEKSVDENILFCVQGKPSTFFADVKEQNHCCRVGQTKIFAKNLPTFEKHLRALRRIWLGEAQLMHKERSECDLHLHMVSTLSSAEDLYQGRRGEFTHKDELWIWIPSEDAAIEHLKSFLNSFRSLKALHAPSTEVCFLGSNAEDLETMFIESFFAIDKKTFNEELPIAVLRFKAGALNSRKGQISPYLPKTPS